MVANRLLILYAGETGNCEDVAKIIYRQSKDRGLTVAVMSISDYQSDNLINEPFVLFICSTTGQGNEPTPLKSFWSFIMRRSLPSNYLNHLSTTVIGLGDSSYIKYNVVGKKLYKRLQSLGANMITDLVLGDDQHDLGLWASIDPWLTNFWNLIGNLMTVPIEIKGNVENNRVPFKSSFQVSIVDDGQFNLDPLEEQIGSIISNERVTSTDHFQEVRFIRIDLNGQEKLNYSPGDVALIQGENFPDEVDSFLQLLNLDGNLLIQCQRVDEDFIESDGYNYLPRQLHVRTLVSKYLDIHSVPKRSFFDLIWKFSPDETERQKLKEFASTEGQQDLYNYCHKPKRNILEVLSDFPHTCSKIPLDNLLDLIPCIRPRAFSIASSLSMYPNELHLLVAVVQYRTKLRKPRLGLCSNYLARIGKGDAINLTIRFSKFDYYFKDEWINYQASGHLKVFTAFSRDNPDKKYYVQDEMIANQSTLIEFMFEKKCTILIAGSSNQMPDDVRNCIKQIILNGNDQLTKEEVEKFISKLESTRKIQYECWS
ncbi:NADPH-dependent diflavin oxidoreductase 1-like [Panonychus citri]|uniref:NADPH-dependent diflavin oxidoreductase 1-like n=1 Tax=Panonychus citri TaxID=50023 RepID=UPI002307382D|nr:NADPH-dependent diflavin oxidoreductase 1-like [Panonychus citri]